jgi:hypothetical protein
LLEIRLRVSQERDARSSSIVESPVDPVEVLMDPRFPLPHAAGVSPAVNMPSSDMECCAYPAGAPGI